MISIYDLPIELIDKITAHLDWKTWLTLAEVSECFKKYVQERHHIWMELFRQEGGPVIELNRPETVAEMRASAERFRYVPRGRGSRRGRCSRGFASRR